jgi:hypothetical protein
MRKMKYFVSHHGPGLASWDQDFMDGEQSLYSAMVSFRRRTVMGYDDVNTYRENPEGVYVAWEMDRRVDFPTATEEDYMEVYHAVHVPEDGGYVLGDWAYRITIGPRKGVRTEKC